MAEDMLCIFGAVEITRLIPSQVAVVYTQNRLGHVWQTDCVNTGL